MDADVAPLTRSPARSMGRTLAASARRRPSSLLLHVARDGSADARQPLGKDRDRVNFPPSPNARRRAWQVYWVRPAAATPVAWMWTWDCDAIHTSDHAGGRAGSRMHWRRRSEPMRRRLAKPWGRRAPRHAQWCRVSQARRGAALRPPQRLFSSRVGPWFRAPLRARRVPVSKLFVEEDAKPLRAGLALRICCGEVRFAHFVMPRNAQQEQDRCAHPRGSSPVLCRKELLGTPVGQDHRAIAEAVGLVHVVIVDPFSADLTTALVADAADVAGLMQADVMFPGGTAGLHRNVDQPECD